MLRLANAFFRLKIAVSKLRLVEYNRIEYHLFHLQYTDTVWYIRIYGYYNKKNDSIEAGLVDVVQVKRQQHWASDCRMNIFQQYGCSTLGAVALKRTIFKQKLTLAYSP
jgi:hypothetical protein